MGNVRKRAYKTCVICGTPFPAPPSSKRICCSQQYSHKRKILSHIGKSNVWSAKAREKQSALGMTDNLKRGTAAAMGLPEGQRGPQNRESMIWKLKDPSGKIHVVINLQDWARNHTDLFGMEPGDRSATRISSGIRQIKYSMEGKRQRPATTYKGWTLLGWLTL